MIFAAFSTFKKVYKHKLSGELKVIHTNRTEGSWKQAKDHFRKMSGSKFESHMAELAWRNHCTSRRGTLYDCFFYDVWDIYPLNRPAEYTYTTPECTYVLVTVRVIPLLKSCINYFV